ncbi:MAG: LPS export ABC transporter periplasmic protein LptC [Tannerellaceae bacterium]|jgi:LPS export ABC transporter protein LptC|nr:LPS export ABC transporter periplasmic protein LptC [Tannerellaceae bacterium]
MAFIITMMIAVLLFIAACSGKKQETVTVAFDPEHSHTMKTTDVATLLSDSGVTRYRAEAELWFIYGKASEPYWYFPDGIYIEQFDTLFNVKAMIKADTAWFYEKQELWKGTGNVEMRSLEGDYISSSIIYWDQKAHKIYSDRFTLIERDGRTIRSQNGFESDEALSYYHLYNSSGNLLFEETPQEADTVATE